MYLSKAKYMRNGTTHESPNFAVGIRINGRRIIKGLGQPARHVRAFFEGLVDWFRMQGITDAELECPALDIKRTAPALAQGGHR